MHSQLVWHHPPPAPPRKEQKLIIGEKGWENNSSYYSGLLPSKAQLYPIKSYSSLFNSLIGFSWVSFEKHQIELMEDIQGRCKISAKKLMAATGGLDSMLDPNITGREVACASWLPLTALCMFSLILLLLCVTWALRIK